VPPTDSAETANLGREAIDERTYEHDVLSICHVTREGLPVASSGLWEQAKPEAWESCAARLPQAGADAGTAATARKPI